MGLLWDLVSEALKGGMRAAVEKTLSSDVRNDPVYEHHVQALIERSRQFEEERNRKFENKK